MTAANLEEEVIAFALDHDTVQNLIIVAKQQWGCAQDVVLGAVRAAIICGDVLIYYDTDDVPKVVEPDELTDELVSLTIYLWMEPTRKLVGWLAESNISIKTA